MKWIKRIVIVVVVLIIVAVVAIDLSLDAIIRSTIQNQATASLGVPTSLGSASLSLFGGKVSLKNLDVNSPPNFSSPDIFKLDGVSVAVQYGQLTKSPVHVNFIQIDNPALVIEQSNLKLNLQALMDQMPKAPASSDGKPAEPMKLIIDQLDLNNAGVTFLPGIPGLSNSVHVTIPSMSLKNIGNADGNGNGAAIKEVVMQVATAMAAKGSEISGLPPEVKALLNGGIGGLSTQLGAEFNKQLQGQVQGLTESLGKNIHGNLGNVLKSGGIDTTQQTQQITKGLGDLLGGKKK